MAETRFRWTYECKLWAAWLLERIPGQVGCALRRRLSRAQLAEGVNIWEYTHIEYPSRLSVGAHSSINRGSCLHAGGGIRIGSNVLVGPGVVIYSQNHHYRDRGRLIAEQGYVRKEVVIEDDVWIAAGATILPGVRLGAGAVVAAGAVVTHSVGPYEVVAGIPAKRVGSRQDMDGRD